MTHPPIYLRSDDWIEALYAISSWSGWEHIPGGTLSPPSLSYTWTWEGEELFWLFVRGTDNGIYYKIFRFEDGWSPWNQLDGATLETPEVASDSAGRIHLVVRGTDNGIYHRVYDGVSWSTWTRIPGACRLLSLTSYGSRLDLVVRGTDNGIYHAYWTEASGWSTWAFLGGTCDKPGLAVDQQNGFLYIAVRGTDNGVYIRRLNLNTGGWSPWYSGGATLSSPAVAAGYGRADIIVRGTDNGIYYRAWTEAGLTPWVRLPGATPDRPLAFHRRCYSPIEDSTFLELIVRGTDNGIYHKTLDLYTGQWTGWTQIPGATPSTPSSISLWGYALVLAVRGTDNGIYFAYIPMGDLPIP
jgi:hypothetical protein